MAFPTPKGLTILLDAIPTNGRIFIPTAEQTSQPQGKTEGQAAQEKGQAKALTRPKAQKVADPSEFEEVTL
ncbi:hypothetical protein [Thermus scotoductus]|uniref:hypothetical protein n=1 Tax=Thermus scotoductus TaxID=37636 RepID=UPI000F7E5E34|nr:hypothetical protein [Thermus scotoductus]